MAEAEIDRAQALIGDLAHPDRLFRPQGGGGALGPHLLNRAALRHPCTMPAITRTTTSAVRASTSHRLGR